MTDDDVTVELAALSLLLSLLSVLAVIVLARRTH